MTYLGMDRAALDRAYDSSAVFPDVPAWRASWAERSARMTGDPPRRFDISYGPGPRQRLDFFPCGLAGAPTAIFFHGGFWSRNSKEVFRFVATGINGVGMNAAVAGYTLAPDARMDRIVQDAREAVSWTRHRLADFGAAPDRLLAIGWSSGAHLVAMLMGDAMIDGGMAISGIYDLEPMRLMSMNDVLRLDAEEARRNSPIHHLPPASRPLVIAYGADELPEFRRHSNDYHAAWAAKGLPGKSMPMPGRHHHSVLEDLVDPGGVLAKELVELARVRQ